MHENTQSQAVLSITVPQPMTQFEKIVEGFKKDVASIGSASDPLEALDAGGDLYQQLADQLVASDPSDQALLTFDQFEVTQIIARLRRGRSDGGSETARQIAWRLIQLNEQRGIKPRHKPFFESQRRALMQDLGRTQELRELLLRSLGRDASVGVLLSCRRFCRHEGRINRARMFDQLRIEASESNFCGFTPEVVREMRAAISRIGNDDYFGPYGSPHADESKPAPPPLFNGLIHIGDEPKMNLRLLRSSNEVDYASSKLKNCLATTYKRRIKSGHSWIVTVEMDGKPVEALEIDQHSRRIVQWAGIQNMPPNPNFQDAVRSALFSIGVAR